MTASTALGLGLALVSAALINLGFLVQHRALARMQARTTGTLAMLRAAIRSPVWLAGQATGWVGFGAQVAAVALAPLAVVQAFAAGGLVLSVPLASGLFGYAVGRRQGVAIVAMALALGVLGFGVVAGQDHVNAPALAVAAATASLCAVGLMAWRHAATDAIAAGMFYGVADAAIKATALRLHPFASLPVAIWGAVACAGTLMGFVAFQRALAVGHAVSGISLMTATTTLAGLGFGLGMFGERLGASPAASAAGAAAIVVVLGCVPVLAAAQNAMAATGDDGVRLHGGDRVA